MSYSKHDALFTRQEIVPIALSSFSYGIWQTWWLAALWLIATLTGMLLHPSIREGTPNPETSHPLHA